MERKLGFDPLAVGIYNRLTTNALTSSYSIYGYAPKGAALPYVTIGPMIGVRKGAADHAGEENAVLIHVWTEYSGPYLASVMMNNVIRALTAQKLALTDGYTELYSLLEMAEIIRDETEPNRDIYHGLIRFRYWMETAS